MYRNILIFGASSTWGAWDTEKGGWVQRLRSFIEKKRDKNDLVYNLGISGDTTEDLLVRISSELENRIDEGDENIIIFSLGINDSLTLVKEQRTVVSLGDYKNNLQKLVDLVSGYSGGTIFVGPSQVNEDVVNPWKENIEYYNKDIIARNEIMKNFCNINKFLFIDIINLFDSTDLEDGLHPNVQGHQKIFKTVKDSLIKNKII